MAVQEPTPHPVRFAPGGDNVLATETVPSSSQREVVFTVSRARSTHVLPRPRRVSARALATHDRPQPSAPSVHTTGNRAQNSHIVLWATAASPLLCRTLYDSLPARGESGGHFQPILHILGEVASEATSLQPCRRPWCSSVPLTGWR
jgi:hypothetical protein